MLLLLLAVWLIIRGNNIIVYQLHHIYVVLIRVLLLATRVIISVFTLVTLRNMPIMSWEVRLRSLAHLGLRHVVLGELKGLLPARLFSLQGLLLSAVVLALLDSVHLFQVISVLPRYLLLALCLLPLLASNIGTETTKLLILDRVLLLLVILEGIFLIIGRPDLLATSNRHRILLINHLANPIRLIISRIGYYVARGLLLLGQNHLGVVDRSKLVRAGHLLLVDGHHSHACELLLLLDQQHLLLHQS